MTDKVVTTRVVSNTDGIQRIDRWFKRHYPDLNHIQLQKLLRSGQIRLDGKRVEASERVHPGMSIRIPPLPKPLPKHEQEKKAAKAKVPDRLVKDLLSRILYRDDDVIVLNKPFGLAVQGGTGTTQHLDGALDALRFGSDERPRLVHRLDRDTSGVLILARHPDAARKLAASFAKHDLRKYYWAVVQGVPKLKQGKIDAALAKSGEAFEKMEHNEEEGKHAVTYYQVIQTADKAASWVALWPVTGRTHQLRAHMALLGTPMLGDPKYGEKSELDLPKKLHLFARRLIIPHPGNKRKAIDAVAPMPEHFKPAWDYFGFQGDDDGDPFRDLRHD